MSWLSKGHKKIERAISNAIPHEHSADRRAQQEAMNAQIKAYQDQTKILQDEQGRVKAERDEQQRKINEKQIRSMRRQFRPAGFMDEPTVDGTSDKLG